MDILSFERDQIMTASLAHEVSSLRIEANHLSSVLSTKLDDIKIHTDYPLLQHTLSEKELSLQDDCTQLSGLRSALAQQHQTNQYLLSLCHSRSCALKDLSSLSVVKGSQHQRSTSNHRRRQLLATIGITRLRSFCQTFEFVSVNSNCNDSDLDIPQKCRLLSRVCFSQLGCDFLCTQVSLNRLETNNCLLFISNYFCYNIKLICQFSDHFVGQLCSKLFNDTQVDRESRKTLFKSIDLLVKNFNLFLVELSK
ncbi:hypothetical protein P9112_006754 [Eukaryota sp. TZLM1-RC]